MRLVLVVTLFGLTTAFGGSSTLTNTEYGYDVSTSVNLLDEPTSQQESERHVSGWGLQGSPLTGFSGKAVVEDFRKNCWGCKPGFWLDRTTHIGEVIALSGNGLTMAVGEPNRDKVSIFQKGGTGWTKQQEIKSPLAGEYFGYAVSLNGAGTVAAVSSPDCDNGSTTQAGCIRVYKLVNAAWETKPEWKISGTQENARMGYSVSLSTDGNTLAVGTPLADKCIKQDLLPGIKNPKCDDQVNVGFVYVYVFENGSWSRETKDGKDAVVARDYENVFFGFHVALQGNGESFVVGAPNDRGTGPSDKGSGTGCAKVYLTTGSEWAQKSRTTFYGDKPGDRMGGMVAMSEDGNVIAIAALESSNAAGLDYAGRVKVYEWQSSKKGWVQRGGDIRGTQASEMVGMGMSLSGDGNVFALGSTDNVKVYRWNPSTRVYTQEKIANSGGVTGDYVALDDAGKTLVVGSLRESGNYLTVTTFTL